MFYAHFATKRRLFIESFNVFVRWTSELIEPPLADEPDPAVRLLMRVYGYLGLQRLSADLLGLARAEALQEDAETRAAVQDALRLVTKGPTNDFRSLRRGSDGPPISDELMAYSMFGATEEIVMRASWDDEFSQRDIMMAHLFTHLAVEAAYTGKHNVAERVESYRGLIDQLVEAGPPVPGRSNRPMQRSTDPVLQARCSSWQASAAAPASRNSGSRRPPTEQAAA